MFFLCEKIRFFNQWKEKVGKWEKGCGCKTDFYKKSIEPKQQLCCLFLFFKHKIIFIQSAKKVFISNWTFGSFVISFGILNIHGLNSTSFLQSLHNSFTFSLHIFMQISNPTGMERLQIWLLRWYFGICRVFILYSLIAV